MNDATIVCACDKQHWGKLVACLPTWIEVKQLTLPIIVFAQGFSRRALRRGPHFGPVRKYPNVRFVKWDCPQAETQRERMLSAFIFGVAREVETEWHLKLDCVTLACQHGRPWEDEWLDSFDLIADKCGYTKYGTMIPRIDYWMNGLCKIGSIPVDPVAEEIGARLTDINWVIARKQGRENELIKAAHARLRSGEKFTLRAKRALQAQAYDELTQEQKKLYDMPGASGRMLIKSKGIGYAFVEPYERSGYDIDERGRITHRRIKSWFKLMRTSIARDIAECLPLGRLPVPSEDTLCWRWCDNLGLRILPFRPQRYGWTHTKRDYAMLASEALKGIRNVGQAP